MVNPEVVFTIFLSFAAGPLVLLFAMRYLGVGRRILCKIGWHSPPAQWRRDFHDGASMHVTCPWCGYSGMVDSQGNLF